MAGFDAGGGRCCTRPSIGQKDRLSDSEVRNVANDGVHEHPVLYEPTLSEQPDL